MIFEPAGLEGAWLIRPERHGDDRGDATRTFCRATFESHGLCPVVEQCLVTRTPKAGTLRGLHLQTAPDGEDKLVRCSRGEIFDVIVDLRRASPTFMQSWTVVLSGENGLSVYAPKGCAHGFVSLVDDIEIHYQMSAPYNPVSATGVRWDDPAFAIAWPVAPALMSDKDAAWPDFLGDGDDRAQ